MTEIITAFTARTQLGSLMKQAEGQGKRFIVKKRGLATAVILGMDDYMRNFVPRTQILEKFGTAAKRKGSSKLSLKQINAEIAAARKAKP